MKSDDVLIIANLKDSRFFIVDSCYNISMTLLVAYGLYEFYLIADVEARGGIILPFKVELAITQQYVAISCIKP